MYFCCASLQFPLVLRVKSVSRRSPGCRRLLPKCRFPSPNFPSVNHNLLMSSTNERPDQTTLKVEDTISQQETSDSAPRELKTNETSTDPTPTPEPPFSAFSTNEKWALVAFAGISGFFRLVLRLARSHTLSEVTDCLMQPNLSQHILSCHPAAGE